MPEIPLLDSLVKAGVLDMPTGTYDLQRRSAGELARALSNDGEAPVVDGSLSGLLTTARITRTFPSLKHRGNWSALRTWSRNVPFSSLTHPHLL
jgi:hypothetical protein